MSLADSLLADLDGLSDDDEVPSQPVASSSRGGGSAGLMLPPPVPARSGLHGGKRSLADDLEDDDDDVTGQAPSEEGAGADDGFDGVDVTMEDGTSAVGYVPEGGVRPAEELDAADVAKTDTMGMADVSSVAKLLHGRKLKEVLEDIAKYTTSPSDMSSSTALEDNPEYHLIVLANNMSVEVDNEILLVHKFIRDHYGPRFPELEQLIGDPWTYVAAVRGIGNADDLTKAPLPPTLPPATILSITLTATATRGRILSPAEWATVERATDVAHELRQARETIFNYVESRMSVVAPNLSAVVGTGIAAKLLGLAGGLQALARTPSCNVALFGALKKSLATSHLSSAGFQQHVGFIYQSSLVQSADPADRRRAQRAVAAKVVLVARTDASKGARDGSYGQKLAQDLEKKIQKMSEPPPNKITKALPIPQETARKKRGGKKARRDKERYATTELGKLANRVEFGKPEQEADMDDETVGLGMIGKTGRVRAAVADSKSKARLSKRNQLRTQLLSRGSADSASGTTTSLSFTPVQGLEIATPALAAAQRVQEANDRWFAGGTFTHVQKPKSNIPGLG